MCIVVCIYSVAWNVNSYQGTDPFLPMSSVSQQCMSAKFAVLVSYSSCEARLLNTTRRPSLLFHAKCRLSTADCQAKYLPQEAVCPPLLHIADSSSPSSPPSTSWPSSKY